MSRKFARSQDVKIPDVSDLVGRFISWDEIDHEHTDNQYIYFISYSGYVAAVDETFISVKHVDSEEVERFYMGRLLQGFIDQKDIDERLGRFHFACNERDKLLARESNTSEYDVYALIDPRNQAIRYVGISYDAEFRYTQHVNCSGNNKEKNAWIQELKSRGLLPKLAIIEVVRGKFTALQREQYWLETLVRNNAPLTNLDLPWLPEIIGDVEGMTL